MTVNPSEASQPVTEQESPEVTRAIELENAGKFRDAIPIYRQAMRTNPTPIVANSPIYATLQLDNGMTLFLRENNLPPDIREYAEHKKQREYKRLREMMKDEGWKPTTQPTTKPANEDL